MGLLTIGSGMVVRIFNLGFAWGDADAFTILFRPVTVPLISCAQALSRDIRNLRQRGLWPTRGRAEPALDAPRYVLVLERVVISYEVVGDGSVRVWGAAPDGSPAAAAFPHRLAGPGGRVYESDSHKAVNAGINLMPL